ncbi:MAG: DUF3500 domain-containing protein [Planctomycetales bacterium]|nr:DUF3500 domain-containing protein [Planctomycetales bacterium]
MKRPLLLVSLLLIALVATSAWSFYRRTGAGEGMTAQASKFLDTLSADQKKIAILPYESEARVGWHFIPFFDKDGKPGRKGLQVRNMDEGQRKAAQELLRSALSEVGYGKATKIMATEALLKELEKGVQGGQIRDTERYYFTVFGAPTADGKWGLSVEGHHLSLNFVVDKGHVVSSTPTAFAANPATVMNEVLPAFPKGTRILKGEEQLAFDLLASLTPEQKKIVIVDEKPMEEVRNAGKPQPETGGPAGIAAAKLTSDQVKILRSLLSEYASNMPADVADERLAAIDKAGFENVTFVWMGAEKPGIGHSYRVQGPTFQIEFVNRQKDAAGNEANHIHCLWRDVRGDFAIPAK